jgi:hypothetical protein
MNTTITFAGRIGSALALLAIIVLAPPKARASQTIITVNGTLSGGNDYLGVFGMGRSLPAGTPYTLVYTIDDTKGEAIVSRQCPSAGSGIAGIHEASPATAVLTIGTKSYVFGRRKDAHSTAWRTVANGCSSSEIGVEITEGQAPLAMGVRTRVRPLTTRTLTQDGDWQSALSLTNVYAPNTYNQFVIMQPGNYAGGAESYLSVTSVTVSGAGRGGVTKTSPGRSGGGLPSGFWWLTAFALAGFSIRFALRAGPEAVRHRFANDGHAGATKRN